MRDACELRTDDDISAALRGLVRVANA